MTMSRTRTFLRSLLVLLGTALGRAALALERRALRQRGGK
jgi:hypothetical protein